MLANANYGILHIYYCRNLREYNIWMAPDLYSSKHTQWFYFRVRGMVAGETYKFHVVNFQKPDSLYNYGKSVAYIRRKARSGKRGRRYRWREGGRRRNGERDRGKEREGKKGERRERGKVKCLQDKIT